MSPITTTTVEKWVPGSRFARPGNGRKERGSQERRVPFLLSGMGPQTLRVGDDEVFWEGEEPKDRSVHPAAFKGSAASAFTENVLGRDVWVELIEISLG